MTPRQTLTMKRSTFFFFLFLMLAFALVVKAEPPPVPASKKEQVGMLEERLERVKSLGGGFSEIGFSSEIRKIYRKNW